MAGLSGIGLEFEETMSGWIGAGSTDFVEGSMAGQSASTPARLDAKIVIPDLDHFINVSDHHARLEGTFTYAPLGGKRPIEAGVFDLFSIEPVTGMRQMVYAFRVTGSDGRPYYFHGHKRIKDDPGFDLIEDMTTLFSVIHEGGDTSGPVYGAGQIFFRLGDAPALLASMKVTGTAWPHEQLEARSAFLSFAWGAIRSEYFRDLNPFYDTEYENLVLSGQVSVDGTQRDFFLVSGVHDRDFPWGDGEVFWDVLFLVGNGAGGFRRFAITDRTLAGLSLHVGDGTYRYEGPVFELTGGPSTSFSGMRDRKPGIEECRATFDIRFKAAAHALTPFPFPVANHVIARMASAVKWILRTILPSEHLPGIFITPHTVTVEAGSFRIEKAGAATLYSVLPDKTFGEAERTTFRSIREPTLLYGYICAVEPKDRTARVQIHTNALRNERQRLAKDQMDALLGAAICRVASKEMLMQGGNLAVRDLGEVAAPGDDGAKSFVKIGAPLIEVANDHFPTAVFFRRIIAVEDPDGRRSLALEEDMDLMRLEAENSTRAVTVASVRDPDKFRALDAVLEKTGFRDLLGRARNASGKPADAFSIVIKPNFMFAYNKRDHSTYTDPELVGHLVRVIRDGAGFTNVTVVEAQSTYGEYFNRRSVPEVAAYVGYAVDGSAGYGLVDLTTDAHVEMSLGPHLGPHPIPLTWKNADFRISFAKNKTHAYAYYTLTLKNIYGALPLGDKFSEYHVKRDIYHTTIEYLRAFPVQYGLIDAHLSADGPFGIFADSEPNRTETILGGEDLVAVDWVGASKMGIDPKISRYMELAVKAFGKPEIRVEGDRSLYRPWLNVPVALSFFTHFGLDANDTFGNLIYMAGAYMDEEQFTHKSKNLFMKAARAALKPIQEAIFLQAGGERTMANRIVGRFFTWLGR